MICNGFEWVLKQKSNAGRHPSKLPGTKTSLGTELAYGCFFLLYFFRSFQFFTCIMLAEAGEAGEGQLHFQLESDGKMMKSVHFKKALGKSIGSLRT